jgi:predicted AAA+ superfamily ATPase
LQGFLDGKKNKKPIILTGSAQLTLLSNISQTLSGRTAIIELLPLAYSEIKDLSVAPKSLEQLLYTGLYPRLYKEKINPSDWYYDYVKTYLERDVRDILKVHNLGTFQRFLKMCASRAGQIVNFSSLANDCGISSSTAESWLNILETTYIVIRIQPHYQNFSKRLIKSPKLYFYDTGLLCFLLGIKSSMEIETHSFRGAIMENWIATEIIKSQSNSHKPNNIFFWRDNKGVEIDFIVEKGEKLCPIEVKSGKTINSDYFKNVSYWLDLAGGKAENGVVVYGGVEDQMRTDFNVYGWRSVGKLMDKI